MSKQTEALKQALEQTLEMLSDNREYIEANERAEYLAMYDKAIAGAEKALAEQPAQQEPVAWVPYLSDRADGVSGHYAIARWNPRGYREVWNLRRHAWDAYSDDVLSLEEADTLLRLIEIPTRKVKTAPADQPAPVQQEPEIVQRVKRYAGKTLRTARNPNITARECIELADWLTTPQAQPAQREWVGLTDEEIEQGCKESWVTEQAWQSAVWWAEEKLKEKNT